MLAAASCTAVSREVPNFFSKLYKDPISAALGGHDSPEMRALLEQEAINSEKYCIEDKDREMHYLYDGYDNCRGDKLMQSLENQLTNEDYQKNNLLFIYTGEAHMNSARIALRDDFDMYFFAEWPNVADKETMKQALIKTLTALPYIRKAPEAKNSAGKPVAVVYGDTHDRDYDFSQHLPVDELKKAGITSITLALEDFPVRHSGKSLDWAKKEWEYFSFEAGKMYDYLKSAENAGIKIKVIGIEE